MKKESRLNLIIFLIINFSSVCVKSDWISPYPSSSSDEFGHFENGAGLEEMEQVPVQDPGSDAESQANLIGMPHAAADANSNSLSQDQVDNEINLIPEQLSSIQASELRRIYNQRRRRQPKIGKFVFPIRYTRKPRFRSSHSALVSGVDSGYGDLANVLASHYGLEKPNKVLRYGIS